MVTSELVRRINSILSEKGIQKQTFFADCGITSSAFSQWATEKTSPRMKKLKEIADYLQTTPEYLLSGSGQKEKPAPSEGDGLVSEWSTAWDQATPEARAAALSVLRLGAQPPEGQA